MQRPPEDGGLTHLRIPLVYSWGPYGKLEPRSLRFEQALCASALFYALFRAPLLSSLPFTLRRVLLAPSLLDTYFRIIFPCPHLRHGSVPH